MPANPNLTWKLVEPLAPVPDTCAGAAMATGRTTIGLRTPCPAASLQVSEPNWNPFGKFANAALVRVIVTL